MITRKLFFLTEEQKGHKLCSFVLMSKVIYFHVSRVSARIFLSTDFTDFTIFPRDTCDTWRQVSIER